MNNYRLLVAALVFLAACASEPEDQSPYLELYEQEKQTEGVYTMDVPHQLVKMTIGDSKPAVREVLESLEDLKVMGYAANQDQPVSEAERKALLQKFEAIIDNQANGYQMIDEMRTPEGHFLVSAIVEDTVFREMLVAADMPDQLHLIRLKGGLTERMIQQVMLTTDLGDLQKLMQSQSNE
jgi:hypothetical protein